MFKNRTFNQFFASVPSFLKDDVSQSDCDPEYADQRLAEQFDFIRANIGTVAIGNIFAGFLSVLSFVGSEQFVKAIMWYLGFLIAVSLTIGKFGERSDKALNKQSENTYVEKHHLVAAIIVALAWAALPILFFGAANMEQHLFIIATMLTLIGAGAFFLSAVPQAAIAFSVVMMGALMIAIFLNWHSGMLIAAVLVFSFTLLVIGMVRKNANVLADRTEAKSALVQSNHMISVLLREHEDSGFEWLWETGPKGKIRNVSRKFAQATAIDETGLEGRDFVSILGVAFASTSGNAGCNREEIDAAFKANMPFRDIVVCYQHPDGMIKWWKLSGRPIANRSKGKSTSSIGYRGAALDITDEKNSEDKIAYLALYDSLTNLPNRASFKGQIEKSISRVLAGSTREAGKGEAGKNGNGVALFLLDLDKFKHINDTLGHPAGDELLISVARRLLKRCGNAQIVARLGGDEFSIVVEGISTLEGAEEYANGLLKCFVKPYQISGRRIGINCSVGVALAPAHGDNADDLIKNADLALYRSKADSNSTCNMFEAEMDLQVRERRQLGQELQSAIANDELFLLYQPLVSTASNKVIGYEALLRWQNPRCGTVNPDYFIPIAEELGMIIDIGKWAIVQACAEAASWKNDMRISVNLSPLQFVGVQLELVVARALGDSGLLPSRLELEITENSLMVNKDATLSTLQNLRALGISIALDDFGTGYSSLSYLMSYPFDKIKIDRSFLSSPDNMGTHAALIRTIIGLAKSLGMRSTVEGVETIEHLEFLRREGCDELQGFLISAPIPASAIREYENSELRFEEYLEESQVG